MNWNFVDDPPRDSSTPLLFYWMPHTHQFVAENLEWIELMEWRDYGQWENKERDICVGIGNRREYPDAWLTVRLPTKQEVHDANE